MKLATLSHQEMATVEPQPGVYGDVPEEAYHASPGVSVSRLKRFAQAPAKAWADRKETNALRFGTLLHAVLLEAETVDARYLVSDLSRNSNAFKELKADAEARGLSIIKQAEYDEAMRLRDAVMAQPIARDILGPGLQTEQSFYWRDPVTGILCRGRTDIVRPEWRALADIKSTEDASAESFARTIATYNYHWQASYYEDGYEAAAGWRPELLLFLAVEKDPPYLCQAFEVEPQDMEAARKEVRRTLDAYAACLRADEWPGYPDGVARIGLPGWARHRAELAASAA